MAARAPVGSTRGATVGVAREQVLDTGRGPARATAYLPAGRTKPTVLVVALHGAGTDTSRPPLPALCASLAAQGFGAVRFDQPYQVAGRKAPDAAHLLDRVLLDALPEIRRFAVRGARLAFVGRSSGARVACRIAAAADAAAIACLGFPYQPPTRKGGAVPADRGEELRAGAAVCPVLVVQGSRDPFGRPPVSDGVRIVVADGAAHVPTDAMAAIAAEWLVETLGC